MEMKENSSKGNEFPEDGHEAENNAIISSSSVVTKVQTSNPEHLLTTDPLEKDLATEVTVYNKNLSLVKERT